MTGIENKIQIKSIFMQHTKSFLNTLGSNACCLFEACFQISGINHGNIEKRRKRANDTNI